MNVQKYIGISFVADTPLRQSDTECTERVYVRPRSNTLCVCNVNECASACACAATRIFSCARHAVRTESTQIHKLHWIQIGHIQVQTHRCRTCVALTILGKSQVQKELPLSTADCRPHRTVSCAMYI